MILKWQARLRNGVWAEAERDGASYREMHLEMKHGEGLPPRQMGEFLKAGEAVRFVGQSRAEVYAWIRQTAACQEYFPKARGNGV